MGEDPARGVEAYDKRATEHTWHVLDALREVADAHAATMSQVALAWVTAQPLVSSTILGVRTLEQLEDNLGAVELDLSRDELQSLDEVSQPVTPDYPYGFLDRIESSRLDQLG